MKEKIKSLLNSECHIILDTNVYLNIYDRSPEFSRFSIEVLESIKDKIIIPSTVYREFLKNYKLHYFTLNKLRRYYEKEKIII